MSLKCLLFIVAQGWYYACCKVDSIYIDRGPQQTLNTENRGWKLSFNKHSLKHQSHIGCDTDATCSRPISLQLTGDRWDRSAHIWNEFMIAD